MEDKYYKEYRYGNLVKYENFILPATICRIGDGFCVLKHFYLTKGHSWINESANISPLPLTNDIMTIYLNETIINKLGNLFIIKKKGEIFICVDKLTDGKAFSLHLRYFHQLQNLYYLFTEKELPVSKVFMLFKDEIMAIFEDKKRFMLECSLIKISDSDYDRLFNEFHEELLAGSETTYKKAMSEKFSYLYDIKALQM